MIRFLTAGLATSFFVIGASAQTPQQNATPPLLNPLLTTGTPVGTPVLKPIGSQLQQVGQQQGTNVGSQTPTWRQDPLPPGGKVIDLRNSVAPVPASSLPPALRPQEPMSLWDQIYSTWASALGLNKPAQQQNNGYVPGMTRRAKERREKRWIWD
jgi:hypothetical protein